MNQKNKKKSFLILFSRLFRLEILDVQILVHRCSEHVQNLVFRCSEDDQILDMALVPGEGIGIAPAAHSHFIALLCVTGKYASGKFGRSQLIQKPIRPSQPVNVQSEEGVVRAPQITHQQWLRKGKGGYIYGAIYQTI